MLHIGVNGGDSHWICFYHLNKWNADRARFLADGGGCEMQRLGELLCDECWNEARARSVEKIQWTNRRPGELPHAGFPLRRR